MALAHFTLATRDIDRTAAFLERTLGYARKRLPPNVVGDAIWLDIGGGQELHVLHVPDFAMSAFDGGPARGDVPSAVDFRR